MEITIGIREVARELTIESPLSAEELTKAVETGLAGLFLDLTDVQGRRILVPSNSIGYIELGTPQQRQVGFGGA